MASTFQKWLNKIQALLFGEKDSKHDAPPSDIMKRQVGRFEADQRQVTPKVIHQYPKQGNFRFPVIEDSEPVKQARKNVESRQQRRQHMTERSLEKREGEKAKFGNRNFRPTSIPSPIYGFQKRVTEQDRNDVLHVDEAKVPTMEEVSITKEEQLVPIESMPVLYDEEAFGEEANATFLPDEEVEFYIEEKSDIPDEEFIVPEIAATLEKEVVPQQEELRESEKERESESSEQFVHKTEERKTTVTKQGPQIPFNVLMLPSDQKRQQKVLEKKDYDYIFPSIQLLNMPPRMEEESEEYLVEQANLLEETLHHFNVNASVVHYTKGPTVTQFEIQLAPGVKVSKVTGLIDDMKLALAARDIRIEAPIPGKNTIGIEVPNPVSQPVFLREILRRDVFTKSKSPLTVALGLDISGEPIVTDLQKMPHGLVAGATGSGKSVCINSILVSLLYRATPDEVKLLLIDPKMVELAPYNDLPHLVTPVITDAKQATAALKWAVEEMERRYELFSQRKVRDIARYNQLYSDQTDGKPAMPYIVIIIDELADLMMVAPGDVEEAICRIAQKARACGIHLLLATQRPSVDVITGLIKANIPTRIAFSVSSQVDSRTILDMNGAERLLGKGDMLFHENGSPKPHRLQGTFVSDDEIEAVVSFVKQQRKAVYLIDNEQLVKVQESFEQDDELFEEACLFVIEQGTASASALQRRFRVGYNRAARLIDMMEASGIVSESMGSKPRNVLLDEAEFSERSMSSTTEEN